MTSTPTSRAVRIAAAALVAGLLAVLGAGVVLAAPAGAATHAITIKQYAYSPAAMTLSQGDTVTWTNQDTVAHDVTVTAGPATFHSPLLAKGQSWSHTFATAGSYSYICSVHPDMRASLTVRPSAPAKPAKIQAPAPAASAPAVAEAPHASPTHRSGAPRAAASSTPATAPAAAPPASAQLVTPAASTGTTLDPLLLVAGASTAVTVFCLLLLTSRPVEREPELATRSATGPDPEPVPEPVPGA